MSKLSFWIISLTDAKLEFISGKLYAVFTSIILINVKLIDNCSEILQNETSSAFLHVQCLRRWRYFSPKWFSRCTSLNVQLHHPHFIFATAMKRKSSKPANYDITAMSGGTASRMSLERHRPGPAICRFFIKYRCFVVPIGLFMLVHLILAVCLTYLHCAEDIIDDHHGLRSTKSNAVCI